MFGIILAGGRASRMGGGDKGERLVGGATILDRVIAALRPQCRHLAISANGDLARLGRHGLPVLPDAHPGQPGPLAGVLAGLDHVAAADPSAHFALTVPNDVPFLPLDLVARLAAALEERGAEEGAAIVCARSAGRVHPVVALWPVALRDDIRRYLAEDRHRVGGFVARHRSAVVEWPGEPLDPFTNVNTLDDLALADGLAAAAARRQGLATST